MSFNVLTAEISHETNSFSLRKTGKQAFMARYALMNGAAIAERGDENTELAGFLDTGRAHGWQVKHVLSAATGPSGKIRRKAFDWLCDPIISTIKQQICLLILHREICKQ
jgi:microcystin degradation protein MlrC